MTDRSALKAYDETISVYDTAEPIKDMRVHLGPFAGESETRRESLSAREKDVVYVVRRLMNKKIAEHLRLSMPTAIASRRRIGAKLQVPAD